MFVILGVSVSHAQIAGSIYVVSGTTAYTAHPTNCLILVNANAGNVTVTLAPATVAGQEVVVMLTGTPANTVTVTATSIIDRNGLRFMGGGASCNAGEAVHAISDGAGNWYVTDGNNNNCTNHISNLPPGAQVSVAQGTAQWQTLYWDNTSATPGWNASNNLTNNSTAGRVGVGTATPSDVFAVGSGSPLSVSGTGKLTTSGGMTLTSLPSSVPSFWLVLDASNNVSKSTTIPATGTGTANTYVKWSNTSGGLTDALVSETGSTITANGDFLPNATNTRDLGVTGTRWRNGWFSGNVTAAGNVNGLTLQANATGFQISGGTTSKTLTVPLDASVSGTNTGDVTLTGENYLSITNQQITANAVNLGNTNATGTLAAARFPALTGDVTSTAGSLATTIANNAVTDAKLRTSAGLSVIGRSANSTGNVADITAATDGHVLRLSGTTLGFGQVATAGITDAAVTYAKIQNMATGKLHGRSTAGTGSVEELGLANGITISAGNVGLGAITPTTVNGLTLQANATGFQISGGTTSKTLTVPLDASVSGTNTGDVTLAGENYLSITNQQITANAVNLGNTNATGTLAAGRFPALTGDVTTTAGSLATTIANNAVTDAKLRTSAGLSVIGRSANSTGNVADITAATDGHVLRLSGTTLGFGQVATAGIADAAVTYAKVQNVTTNKLLGRATAGSGAMEEITLGTGLSFTGTTLNASGGTGVLYDQAGAQTTSTTPANYLFNVGYSGTPAGATYNGAVITANGSASTATNVTSSGLAITAVGKGTGTATALSLDANGGANNYELSMKGTGTGVSTFSAGAQGTTNINYTMPTSIPPLGATLLAQSVSGSNVTLAWGFLINASTTLVVPSGITSIKVTAKAGNGGGGVWTSGNQSMGGGGGGGEGAYYIGTITVTAGEILTITVGAGGTAGARGADGGNGTVTQIVGSVGGTYVSLNGGVGGKKGVGGTVITAGVGGTPAATGTITGGSPATATSGATGTTGTAGQNGATKPGGAGGPGGTSGPFGSGGAGGAGDDVAGGTGSANGTAGGAGAPGSVIITF